MAGRRLPSVPPFHPLPGGLLQSLVLVPAGGVPSTVMSQAQGPGLSTPHLALINPAIDPPMTRKALLRVSVFGFGLLVILVLLAAYVGYTRSTAIQDSARALVREHLVNTARAAQLEARIEQQTKTLLDELVWVLGLCALLAAGTAGVTTWVIQQAFAKLEWQSAELEHVSWHMLDGHEKMARRFSHEMHDELGQSLSGLRGMLSRVKEADFGALRPECIGVVDEVLQSVRKLSQVLRPVILDDFGLDSGLRWLCERFSQRTQINVDYSSNQSGRMAEPLETHLFRIAQEGLTNIARHSGATQAWVSLLLVDQRLTLTITDNGHGLPASPAHQGPSLGMVGMRARARQVHGDLTVQNRQEGGLRIQVDAPLQKAGLSSEQEDSSFVG